MSIRSKRSRESSLAFLLEEFSISDSQISRIPLAVFSFSTLKSLTLENTLLSSLPHSLINLDQLKSLFIGDNEQLVSLPDWFPEMKLLILDISRTLISKQSLINLPVTLTAFYARYLNLKNVNMSNLPNISILDLHCSNITELVLNPDSPLQQLIISMNSIETLPGCITDMPLNFLDCTFNFNLSSLPVLPNILNIYIQDTNLDTVTISSSKSKFFKSKIEKDDYTIIVYQ